ncbi:caspase, EACC1-associated type [Streptomyces sp. Je 1-369]|uniref:caspase, EACC1-associated type n=1 Tax=Streptomyces sp. Je 1-369 TaxID=2966192 RepID=UPI00228546D4|nr:PQQ-binding-like beta-propeller repeat protein [Streptomyces sp. Je 1-369]WAL98783.1 PQQ-binding-like beta-propeller repeat protein [Streptomyces sp. Je 1-369]
MGRKLALLIATYAYEDEGLRQLTAPGHDAVALAEVLRDPDIAGFEVTILVNEPLHRVGAVLGEFFHDCRHDDLTLLYFTGHGLKDDEGRLHLATADTRRTNLAFTSLSAEQIDRAMSGCMSRQQVLILDCCYSGAFPAGWLAKGDADVHTLERFQGRGRTVLTASDATQYSFEGDHVSGSAARSVFTRHLVHGLREGTADLDDDGNITLDELYVYVHDKVVDEMPQQRPKRQDNVEGRIVIARNVNWAPPVHLGEEPTARASAPEQMPLLQVTPLSVPTPVPLVAGRMRWVFRTGGCVRSVPAVVDGVVYVGSDDGALYAIDATTGEERWRRMLNAEGVVRSTPIVNGAVVFTTADRSLYAVDARTGALRWERLLGSQTTLTVGIVGSLVYVGASNGVYAYNAEDGQERWRNVGQGMTSYQWMVLTERLVIVGNTGSHVYGLPQADSGKTWATRIPHRSVSGPSALSDDMSLLYVGNSRGELRCVGTSDGERLGEHGVTGKAIYSAPTYVSGSTESPGTIYVGNDDGHLYALEDFSYERKWRFVTGAPVRTSPAVDDATVYFGSDDGIVYGVDVTTGLERWRFSSGGPVRSSPTVMHGLVYVGSDDKGLYALQATY